MTWTTPDLCDRFPEVSIAEPLFRSYGGRAAFSGPIVTVRCFEDNSRVRELASTPGDGRVLVVDGQGSLKHALLGDQIAMQAVANGWAGVLIHGCVRDVEILARCRWACWRWAPARAAPSGAIWVMWMCR